jgi:hypothetical protein
MFEPVNRPYSNGISWGFRGFRVGRNQFGNWWISLGLPFGFRYSKTLGKLKSSSPETNQIQEQIEQVTNLDVNSKNVRSQKWKNLK